jgi:uncharacterized repeat protein (TIGR03833 family)
MQNTINNKDTGEKNMPITLRSQVPPGTGVNVVQKEDQRTGKLTQGVVQDILTNSANHPRGIKVRLTNGIIGRVESLTGGDR